MYQSKSGELWTGGENRIPEEQNERWKDKETHMENEKIIDMSAEFANKKTRDRHPKAMERSGEKQSYQAVV